MREEKYTPKLREICERLLPKIKAYHEAKIQVAKERDTLRDDVHVLVKHCKDHPHEKGDIACTLYAEVIHMAENVRDDARIGRFQQSVKECVAESERAMYRLDRILRYADKARDM